MNTISLTLRGSELDELCSFLELFVTRRTPAYVRLHMMEAKHSDRIIARLVPLLCSRLVLRLTTARVMFKPSYRFNIPAEQALALVHALVSVSYEDAPFVTPSVQALIGNLDKALA